MAHVFIPPAIRSLTGGQQIVDIHGTTVGEVIDNLDEKFPGTKDRICRNGSVRPGLSIVVGGSVSGLGLLQHVEPQDEIHFLPSIGGG